MKKKFKIKFNSKQEKLFFLNLTYLNQKKFIKILHNIDKISNYNIPIRFKILDLNISNYNKFYILQLYDNFIKLDSTTQEYFKYKIFFDYLLHIPFNNFSILNIPNINSYLLESKTILDSHIYGHYNIKNYILQILSQYITNPYSNNIIGFYGPPGVGKTSFAYVISKILKRPLEIINLSGAQDTSFLEGHSFTYEGSKPGKIINSLIKHNTMNPIIFFDEVDKISKTEKGFELEKLLINIADNTQNNNFNDKYFMELNFDLSKILFIFSYNNKKFIDPILYDRIFEIEFKNYNKSQKLDLCKKFIIPNLFNNYSFKHNSLIFSDDSITFLINKYSHKSSGIRTIKKVLNNIISKIHIIYISNNSSIINIKYNITFPFTINISNINNFL